MKKTKVLIIAGTMNVGGIENQLMHLIRNANPEKFQIDYTTTIDHPFYEDEIKQYGGRCIKLPQTAKVGYFQYCKALYSLIKNENYDVVHSHELFHSGMVLFVALLAGAKKRIAHAHSSNQHYTSIVKNLYHISMRLLIHLSATDYFACSSLAGEFLYGKKAIQSRKYHLIVNSVDTKVFLDESIDSSIDLSVFEGYKNVIQIGRFSDEKNFVFTTKLAKECKDRNSGIHFICIGNNGNEYEKEVRKLIEEYHIENEMILLGVRKDVAQLMKKVDCFLLPSKYEGMPLTLIEAQSSCLPCVVADTFSHEVDFNINAIQWLSLNDPIEKWVDAIEEAIRNGKKDRNDVVKAIHQYGFDSRDFARILCEFYTK